MAGARWEVQDGERVIGPYPEEQVRTSIGKGLPSSTRVRREGTSAWAPIGETEPFAASYREAVEVEPDAERTKSPPPRATERLLFWIGAGAIVGLLAIGLLVKQLRQPPPPPPGRSTDELLRDIDILLAKQKEAEKAHAFAQQRANAASAAWARWHQLPKEQRTIEALQNAYLEAQGQVIGVSEPWATRMRVQNEGIRRQNAAPIFAPEGTAKGAAFEVLAPNPILCPTAAKMLLARWPELYSVGFTVIECPAQPGETAPRRWAVGAP